MTLQELDDALVNGFGMDFNYPECVELKNEILRTYGESILQSRSQLCQTCWQKEHMECNPSCVYHGMDDLDPIGAATKYLNSPNDVRTFPFICMVVIPAYERATGKKGILEELGKWVKRHLTRKKSD